MNEWIKTATICLCLKIEVIPCESDKIIKLKFKDFSNRQRGVTSDE